jgi:hypothetical protein
MRSVEGSEAGDQRLALRWQKKGAPVVVAGLLHDIPFIEQLLEDPSQRLHGDAHVQRS